MSDVAPAAEALNTEVDDFFSIVERLRDDLFDVRGLLARYQHIQDDEAEVEMLMAFACRADRDLGLIAARFDPAATTLTPSGEPTRVEEEQVGTARDLRDTIFAALGELQRLQDPARVYH